MREREREKERESASDLKFGVVSLVFFATDLTPVWSGSQCSSKVSHRVWSVCSSLWSIQNIICSVVILSDYEDESNCIEDMDQEFCYLMKEGPFSYGEAMRSPNKGHHIEAAKRELKAFVENDVYE